MKEIFDWWIVVYSILSSVAIVVLINIVADLKDDIRNLHHLTEELTKLQETQSKINEGLTKATAVQDKKCRCYRTYGKLKPMPALLNYAICDQFKDIALDLQILYANGKPFFVSKKEPYEEPEVQFVDIYNGDIITCSDDRPGHGYGDNNHNHKHWKDEETENDIN